MKPPPSTSKDIVERFLTLVKRDVALSEHDQISIVNIDEPLIENIPKVSCSLPNSTSAQQVVVVYFSSQPSDLEARQRRLDMLVEAFEELLIDALSSSPLSSQQNALHALHNELQSLCTRTHAVDAFVIDEHSPILWSSANLEYNKSVEPISLHEYQALQKNEDSYDPTLRAIAAIQQLPNFALLHKGAHLHHCERGPDFGYITRSFASIYVLGVVYTAPFDELGAERVIAQNLPTIEKLVLMMPPINPPPVPFAKAASVRRRS